MAKEKKITIKDIALMAGTSKTTVSFYLNGKTDKMSEETKNKIAKVIQETHYTPSVLARSLNDKNSHLIGVVIGDITNTFSNQIVKGIESVTGNHGYQIIVGNSDYNDQKESVYIEQMISMGVEGFIIQPTARFRKLLKKIEKLGKPIVFFDSKLFDLKTKWVKTNNYEATYEATCKCIEKGYEEFYMITANPQLISTRLERTSGFVDALGDHDLKCETCIIENDCFDPEQVTCFIQEHVNLKKKSLIFVPNCWALPKVFMAMKNFRTYMPQLGLLGIDNTEWTNLSSPTISTIVQPAYQEGVEAGKIIIAEIENKHDVPNQQVLDCTVNWNESTY